MTRQIFMVAVEIPDGVSISEFASHLCDSHRARMLDYIAEDPTDPMCSIANFSVFAGVDPADLTAPLAVEEPVARLKVVGQN